MTSEFSQRRIADIHVQSSKGTFVLREKFIVAKVSHSLVSVCKLLRAGWQLGTKGELKLWNQKVELPAFYNCISGSFVLESEHKRERSGRGHVEA